MEVLITGSKTNFDESSIPNMGGGITINNVNALSSTLLTASISISESTYIRFRDVSVVTESEYAYEQIIGPFLVSYPPAIIPELVSILPNTGNVGQTLFVQVEGINTNFEQGSTILSFSGGEIAVNNLTVNSETSITAEIHIEGSATPGFKDVFVTTGTESAVLLNGFFVSQIVGHLIDLSQGWSIISTYQNPDTPQLETIFADQIANSTLEILLGKSGIFWPAYNINLIGDWNPYEGYKVKMNENDQVIISGEIVEDKSVELAVGVNYLPVLNDLPVPATDIFSQIESELLYAFDLVNNLVYWPQGDLFTLETLEPGKGYLVSMLAPGSVSYPATKGMANYVKPQKQIVENAPWTFDNTGIAHIISVYNSALTDVQSGDIIAAFNSKEVCVGMAQYGGKAENLALIAYGDDFTTEAVDGMIEDELMHFAVYRPSTKETIQVQPSWDVSMTHSGMFAENGLSAITSLKLGALGLDDETLKAISIYPNPSNGLFNLHGIESAVDISVLNSTGQEIQKLQTSTSTQIDLSKVSKGIYFVKMISENAVRIEKIIVE